MPYREALGSYNVSVGRPPLDDSSPSARYFLSGGLLCVGPSPRRTLFLTRPGKGRLLYRLSVLGTRQGGQGRWTVESADGRVGGRPTESGWKVEPAHDGGRPPVTVS